MRHTGRLLSVSESPVGTTLAADAAAGATSITVDDPSVFDADGGSLLIGAQVVAYATFDDETGVVTLSEALTDAADTDDAVSCWSTLYDEVETTQTAQVAVLGDRDQADTLSVEVADWVEIENGDRGKDGENCVIEQDGDVWTLIAAPGRPSKARGIKFEADDAYTITAADVTAASATIPLTHRPIDESLKLWWRVTFQPPTEYTVDAEAQTVTLPLGAFVEAGDVVSAHYAYRKGLRRSVIASSSSSYDHPVTAPDAAAGAVVVLAIMLEAGAAVSNLNGYTALGESAPVTHAVPNSTTLTYRLALYSRIAPSGTLPVPTFTSGVWDTPWVMVAFVGGGTGIAGSDLDTLADGSSFGTPTVAGHQLRAWGTVGVNQHITAPGRVLGETNPPADPSASNTVNIVVVEDTGAAPATVGGTAGWCSAAVAVTGL